MNENWKIFCVQHCKALLCNIIVQHQHENISLFCISLSRDRLFEGFIWHFKIDFEVLHLRILSRYRLHDRTEFNKAFECLLFAKQKTIKTLKTLRTSNNEIILSSAAFLLKSFSRAFVAIGRVFQVSPTHEKTWNQTSHRLSPLRLSSTLVWRFPVNGCVLKQRQKYYWKYKWYESPQFK